MVKKINWQKLAIPLVILMLAWQSFWLIYAAKADSQTTDEAVHLSAGYTYLTRFDYRFNPEHPPLAKYLAAVPLLFLKPQIPNDSLYWDKVEDYLIDSYIYNNHFGRDLLYRLGNDTDQLLFWGRVPMILLTLLLGLSIFFISRKLFGFPAGLLSLAFFSLSPNIMAHGHLVTTDIIASLFFLLSIWVYAHFLEKPKPNFLIITGVVLGLAELSKFTLVMLYPIFILLFLFYAIKHFKAREYREIGQTALKVLLIFLISWVVVWAGYGFKMLKPPRETSFSTLQHVQTNPQVSLLNRTILINETFSIPRDYFKGMSMVLTHTSAGHTSYLFGETSTTGWWYYFPVIFLFKTPLPTLIVFLLTLVSLAWVRQKDFRILAIFLGGVFYLVFSMFSKANLGVRHILPFYATLFVLLGYLVKEKAVYTNWKYAKAILAGLLVWLFIDFLFIAPAFLTYFNELAGGSLNGYKIALDSNLDWGQDIHRLKQYLDEKKIQKPYIQYGWDGEGSLEYYGIDYLPVGEGMGIEDIKGFLVINATAFNEKRFQPLKNLQPYDRIGSALFVYNLK